MGLAHVVALACAGALERLKVDAFDVDGRATTSFRRLLDLVASLLDQDPTLTRAIQTQNPDAPWIAEVLAEEVEAFRAAPLRAATPGRSRRASPPSAARSAGLSRRQRGAIRGSRGMRDGSNRRRASSSISRGDPSTGSCPSARSANARAPRTRASSSVSSGERAVSLPELLPVRPEDERKVRVRRRRKAERALKRDLPRGRVEEVRAAHDLA